MVKDHPVMVIPSGGLYGLEKSSMLKAQFDEYVKNGGTLIVFSQQHGYEFSILPVPQEADGTYKTITGYGWTEDQSCLWNGTYVDTYHQILSAISKSTVSANVDGYFTSYPSNSTVLLRRTANGQPAMLMYDYGQGKVIVSSMFSDWGHAHSQATQDEISIVRDMISWAKKPAALPEIKPGQTASVQVEVKNNTSTDASLVKLLIYNPDRTTLLSEQTLGLSIPAGSSAQLVTNYSSLVTDVLGIYHIDYELYNSQGVVIQPQAETDSGRFVVSSPPSNPYKSSDLFFSVTTPTEEINFGQDISYTVTIWNNSDKDKKIKIWKDLNHFWEVEFLEEVVVPAKGSLAKTYVQNSSKFVSWAFYFPTINVHFFEENGNSIAKPYYILASEALPYAYVGTAAKRMQALTYPLVELSVMTNKPLYAKGETINLTLNILNKKNVAYTTALKVRIADSSNASVYSTSLEIGIPAGESSVQNLSFVLPLTSQGGFYTVSTEAYDSLGKKIGTGSSSFEIPRSQIVITPNLFAGGTNTISFGLSNTGKISVSEGILDVTFKDPDSAVIYSGNQSFALGVGQSTAVNFPVSIPSLKFGNYTLSYSQSDETRAGQPTTLTVPNSAAVAMAFDRASYRVRETANLIVSLSNTGKFNQEAVSVSVSVPDVNYTNTQTIIIGLGQNQPLQYLIPISETTMAGQHDINVTVTLQSGSSIVQSAKLTIPESSLLADYLGPTIITAGDTINLTVKNTGGVDTNYTTEKISIVDKKGVIIYQGNISGTIFSGEEKTLVDIQIPQQTADGQAFLITQIKDNRTGKQSYLSRIFNVVGLTAELQTMTGKNVYLKTEATTGLSSILNGQFGIDNGNLKVTVSRSKTGAWQFTKWGSSGSGDGQFNYPYGIAVDDKYVYVADYNNHRIQIFDKFTYAFVGKFGSYGSGNGQFLNPQGIAVDDNYLYVGDIYGSRIQVFNKLTYSFERVFGRGQVVAPYGLAVDNSYIYVSDQYSLRVFDKFTYSLKRSFGSGFNHPYNIAVDDSKIYATDVYNSRVQIYDKSTYAFLGMFGSNGNGDGQLSNAFSVAVDNLYIYVTDWSGKLQIFNKDTYAFVERVRTLDNSGLSGPIAVYDSAIYLGNLNRYIQKITRNTGGNDKLFETTIPINQSANTSQDYTANIGILNATGKLYLNAELKNNLGQTLAAAEYPFYVIEGNTLLLFATDKKVYKTGETVTITGEVRNFASITASGLTFNLSQQTTSGSQDLYTVMFDLPANGSYPFTVTTTAYTEGIYTLTGKVTQNNFTLAEIAGQYEASNPKVTASVSSPEVVGNDAFDINMEIQNEGKTDASLQLFAASSQGNNIDNRTIRVPAGETKLIQYQQQITSNTAFTFTFSGDLNSILTKTVSYGLAATIAINQQTAYPEGRIALPVTISNAGQIDATIDTGYRIQDSSNNIIQEQTKTYYIPKGGSTTDTLYYDLTEGNYTLTAEGFPASGNDNPGGQPLATANASFSVKKENNATMAVTVGSQASELIPVTVSLTNNGYNDINGSVQLSVINSAGQTVWNSNQDIVQLIAQNSQLLNFNINPSSIQPGNYDLKAELLNNSNQQIAVINQPLTIKGPVFQIAQIPPYQTFIAGQEAVFTFKIKNTGNQEGAFDLHFKAYDLIDSTRREWIRPGEEKTVSFSFFLPDDLEKNDYFADYELNSSNSSGGSKGQIKYHVAGINLKVNAALDKQNYRDGETAHLTIAVSSQQSAVSQNLFARVNYNGYENQQSFALTSTSTLTFDIPLTEITGEKLFYGVYHESGRSIHLNSLYIYKAGDVITITTNKQVYDPGETVSVSVTGNTSGTMTMAGPGYSEVFSFSGNASKSFVLPSAMSAGTYFINAELQTANSGLITASHPVDIAGMQVKVLECRNDKGKYASTDTIRTDFKISSNRTMPAALKAWIIDPDGRYTSVGEHSINLVSSENILLTLDFSLLTSVSGIHRLVYGIYSGGLLLVSGSEAFDVGDVVLHGISTDKTDYPENTEPVNVTVSMYGTVDSYLELQLDGATVKNESVSLNGFRTLNIELGTVKPGIHVLKGILKAGGLTSARETRFTYAMSLLDSDGDGMPDEWELAHGLDPNNPADASLDPDNDGLTNLQEYYNRTNPNISNTDNDGMPDGWEVAYRLNPNVNDAASDKDGDGYINLEEYQKGSNPNDPASIPNQAPVAHAGRDQNIIAGTVVTLDGSESYDPEGAMITFLWGFTEVPAGSTVTNASLSDPTSAKPAFIADVKGAYRAYLIVNDGRLASAPDEMEILASVPNASPNADAGPDQNAITGGMVIIDGSRSSDPDNWPQPLSFLWGFDLVPPKSLLRNGDISGRNQAVAGFVPDAGGAYVMRLTVSDGDLASEDSMTILASAANVPPNADAGSDITVYLGETAVPDASSSNDPDNGPYPLSYQWRFVAVPIGSKLNNGSIVNPETAAPSFTPDVTGTYVLELTVSDGQGYGFDNMAVTVVKRAATLCSILGNDPKPSILDQDIFRFTGTKGEQISILLEATPTGAGSGKRATLLLVDNIAGVLFAREDRTILPNEIAVKLPATGEYLVTVAEQPLILPGERYRGAYCLALEASPKTLQSFSPAFWVE